MELLSHSEELREGDIPMGLEKKPCVQEGQTLSLDSKMFLSFCESKMVFANNT